MTERCKEGERESRWWRRVREKHEMWDKQERRRVMGGKGGIIEERKRLRKLEGKVEQGLERREDLGKL